MRPLLGWIGRRALLYLGLVIAIGFASFVLPTLIREWNGAGEAEANATALERSIAEVEAMRNEAQARLNRDAERFGEYGAQRLTRELATRRAALAEAEAALGEQGLLDRVNPSAILNRKRGELRIAVLRQEIAALQSAQEAARAGDLRAAAAARVRAAGPIPTRAATQRAQRRCEIARRELAAFENGPWIEGAVRELLRSERSTLIARRDARCKTARMAQRKRAIYDAWRTAQARYDAARQWSVGTLDDVTADLDAALAAERNAAQNSLRARTMRQAERWHVIDILRAAGWAFLAVVLMPYAIRLLFWFVLAPLAQRRAAIRLCVPGGAGAAIPPAPQSRASVAIRLREGEQLLVRQDYLQTSSDMGAKRTQWLLDPRHPLSSIAAGMTFLTRITGDGEVTTISATRDPFAEIAVLDLPEGGACVLQPRALAAVAQPRERPMRVTSHWRLFSLNAWLTLQLRYLVFHGPARLAIKGGRGVRVERAERGRIFGQDQLVGFSADLAYSVTRTETFWPYFLGREQLLKDKVERGTGVLIVEEAPMAGRRGTGARGGLEGAFDTALKAFGL
ncbi:hypothetical protein [Croceicoccus hydrothermalis]|uniref:hypothetical protein n=1 Tax=Croceicoccus hydrothermalis TaxID=2867964 RepID=UPI001EFA8942|nr:hypothetical protein [Croceicoccus hydrothermalis]